MSKDKKSFWIIVLILVAAFIVFVVYNKFLNLELLIYVCLGIVISIILPILRSRLPKSKKLDEDLCSVIKPFAIVGLFSLLASILILAFLGDSVTDFKSGLLAGYAWDSTLQKIAETD